MNQDYTYTVTNTQNDSLFELEKRTYKKWSNEDNQKYITFLKNRSELFADEKVRRKSKVFKLLSK
jgi:hypothetical protein